MSGGNKHIGFIKTGDAGVGDRLADRAVELEVDGKCIQMDDRSLAIAVIKNNRTDFQIVKDLIPHPLVEISGK